MSGATGNPQWHEGQIAQNPSNTARRNPKPDKHHVESRDNLVEISEESLLCGAIAYVASSRVTPRIQPFQDLERHITFPSHSRTARACLGVVSLATTNVYLEVGLEMKAKALANCENDGQAS